MAVETNYEGSPKEAFEKIKAYIESGRLPPQLSADNAVWEEDAHRVKLSGKGFEAAISSEGSDEQSKVILDLKLGLLLKGFRKQIESQVISHLEKALNKN